MPGLKQSKKAEQITAAIEHEESLASSAFKDDNTFT